MVRRFGGGRQGLGNPFEAKGRPSSGGSTFGGAAGGRLAAPAQRPAIQPTQQAQISPAPPAPQTPTPVVAPGLRVQQPQPQQQPPQFQATSAPAPALPQPTVAPGLRVQQAQAPQQFNPFGRAPLPSSPFNRGQRFGRGGLFGGLAPQFQVGRPFG